MKYAYSTLALATLALTETIQVQVGPGLNYSPDTVTAAEGDIVQFTFGSGHDVVSGSFDSPCQDDGMIYSGMPNDGDVFSVTINSTDPIWIYCSVPQHCQRGMAMVINAPSDGNTLDEYKSASSGASSSEPDSVTGGTFAAVSDSGSSESSSSEAAASSTAASSPSSTTDSGSTQSTDSGSSGESAAASTSAAESAASAAATSEAAGGSSDGAAGNLVAPLSLVLGAVMGGAALLM